MIRVLTWFVLNSLFATGIYYGFYVGIEGAENVTLLFAWITIFMSFFALAKPVVKGLSEKGRSVPAVLGVSVDLLIMASFAWFGAWVTAIFFFIAILMETMAFEEAKKLNTGA